MTYAIVHIDNPKQAAVDVSGYVHIYEDRELAERTAKELGPQYKVVPW